MFVGIHDVQSTVETKTVEQHVQVEVGLGEVSNTCRLSYAKCVCVCASVCKCVCVYGCICVSVCLYAYMM